MLIGPIYNYIPLLRARVRFDRNELSGAFGDIGTTLPLIAGILMTTGMDGMTVFIAFGLMQVATGFAYGIPMPVQPLKAAALIVITQKLGAGVLAGGGLAIGVLMLALTLSGTIEFLGVIIPKAVVRGIQAALGMQLMLLALMDYIPSGAAAGLVPAGLAFIAAASLRGNRRFPPALAVIAIGAVYGIAFGRAPAPFAAPDSFSLTLPGIPSPAEIAAGFLALALPQVPLSLGNSIYASGQMVRDFFPGKSIPPARIALTYSLMNIVSPLVGGIPVCHGSGGMAGHYAFGARTGGSVALCGILFIGIGLCFGAGGAGVLALFPKPVLGVILLFEGFALTGLARDMAADRSDLATTLIVGITAVFLPYGYLMGMCAGTLAHYAFRRKSAGAPNSPYILDAGD